MWCELKPESAIIQVIKGVAFKFRIMVLQKYSHHLDKFTPCWFTTKHLKEVLALLCPVLISHAEQKSTLKKEDTKNKKLSGVGQIKGSTLQVSYSLMLAVSKRYVVLHPPYMPGGLYQHCHLQNDLVQVYVEELLNEEEEKEIKCKSESTSIVDVEQPGSCRYFFQIPHGFEATSQEKVSLQRIVTCGRKRKREVLKTEELKEVDEEKDNEISGRNDKHVELYPNSASFDSHLKYSPQSSMNYAKSDPVNQLEDVELKTHNLSSDLENSKKKDISHEAVMKEALDYHVCERFSESSKTAVSAENNLQLDGDIEKTCNKATSKIVRAKLKEGAENFMITNDSQLASETASRLNSNIGLASKRCKKNQSTSVKGRNRIARKRSQNCDWFYSELHSSDSDKETSVGKSKIQPRGKLSLKRKR